MLVRVLTSPFRLFLHTLLTPIRILLYLLNCVEALLPSVLLFLFAFCLGLYWRDLGPYLDTAKQLARLGLKVSSLTTNVLASVLT